MTIASSGDAPPRRERFREGITMALYVSVSLQAVLLATPRPDIDASPVRVALTLFLTAIGLLLAHQFAFRMSTRVLNDGLLDKESLSILRSQAIGGLPVAVIASLPVLILGGRSGLLVAEILLISFVGLVGYRAARAAGASHARASLYVGGLVVVVMALLAFKIAVSH